MKRYTLIAGHFDIADILIQNGAKAWWNSDTKHHLLYSLCDKNKLDAVTFLLEHHQEARDHIDEPVFRLNRTPLLECCLNNNVEMVKILVKYGADLDKKFRGESMYEIVSEIAEKKDRKELLEYLSLAMKKEPKNFSSQNNFTN